MNLYEKHNYINKKVLSITNSIIREYDMKSAGLNLIKEYELLPKYEIDKIDQMEKSKQNVYIGILQQNDEVLTKNLNDAFVEARKLFFESNNIDENKVLSIKKDAIFLINTTVPNKKFGRIEFVEKNKYSCYINLNRNQFFYNKTKKKFDIKGISNKEHALLEYIKKIIQLLDSGNKDILFQHIQKLRKDYLELNLDIECYRELNNGNLYKINTKLFKTNFSADYLSNDDKNLVDINYNYFHYLIPLIQASL